MPTLGFHVPNDSELAKQVISRAKAEKHPSVSAYVRKLVVADLNGGGPFEAMSRTILFDLTTRLLGDLDAEDMKRITAWGEPKRKTVSGGAGGSREQWVYEGTYVYFREGKLVSWSQTR